MILLLSFACGNGSIGLADPTLESEPQTSAPELLTTNPVDTDPVDPEPPPADCDLLLSIEPIQQHDNAVLRFDTRVANISEVVQTFDLYYDCIAALPWIEGMAGYQWFDACVSDCDGISWERITLEPGDAHVFPVATLDPSGSVCNDPVRAREIMLSFDLPLVDPTIVQTCGPDPIIVRVP